MVLGVSITLTALVAFGVAGLLSDGPSRWSREWSRAEHFASGRFAAVWDEPAARAELSSSLARDLELQVVVTDAHGAVLERHGPATCSGHAHDLPVTRAGARLGTVRFCALRPMSYGPVRVPLSALIAGLVVLWLAAGFVARRLARPLRELTRVAQEIGDGKLESRARLAHGPGEIGELARSIDEMAERIEGQLKAQKELLATVSHELRTPLARVRLLVDIARDGAKDRDVLTEIEAEMVEMDGLVGELLAGARLDFGAVAPRELTLRPLLERQVARFAAGATIDIAPDAELVRADATLLARAMGAMLDNAKKHGGPHIAVRARRNGNGAIALAVEDDGPGFPDGAAAELFEPFRRGDGPQPGWGLGLSIVKRIAVAHKGRAHAENRPEGGARVVIELPV